MTRIAEKQQIILKRAPRALLNYLHATGCEFGLLVNFGDYPGLDYERILTRKQETEDVYL
jgi:hypothetical protein